MKILLLADIPPCTNFTGGLYLDRLCRFLPKGSIACFAVIHPKQYPQISPELDWMPLKYYYRPPENWNNKLTSFFGLSSVKLTRVDSYRPNKKIIAEAIEFARQFNPDVVWCILDGKTMLQTAVPIATGLGLPLLAGVWDPPSWWLGASGLNPIAKARVLNKFDHAVRSSSGCATASWAMAEQYRHDYGARTVALLPSLDLSLAMPPAKSSHAGKDFVIGVAGTIYAMQEWRKLLGALNQAAWKICDREVSIRILGRRAAEIQADGEARVEFLGWRSQGETVRLLAETDVLYCPYWFDPAFEQEARLSFPSKLTTYLASGRPVLFHGPEYAAPALFLQEHAAGVMCHAKKRKAIIKALSRLAEDQELYARTTENGRRAFEQHLTLAALRKSFADFLQVDPDFLLKL